MTPRRSHGLEKGGEETASPGGVAVSQPPRAALRDDCVGESRFGGGPVNPRGGFALLITITLLAFIVVLLLGLAVYTRVETAVAGNMQRQAQARENALLGLDVALSQLQKYAGPDTRITATAANFGAIDGTRHYTGVWSSNPAATTTPAIPMTWLVSGNEIARPDIPDPNPDAPEGSMIPAPLAVTPADPGFPLQTLVGFNTTGDRTRSANWVDAPLVNITATGVPGVASTASPPTIGRYAWWVGDQGVKAPVAVPDMTSAITFAPYVSDDGRARIRQQLALGAGAINAVEDVPIFEPRDASNAALVADNKVAAINQLAFLRTSSNTQVGLAAVRQNFHAWSPNNFAVLVDSKRGGLREDLSLMPGRLGTAFSAWARYDRPLAVSMEPPVQPEYVVGVDPPPPLPAYGSDPLRRRFFITPNVTGGGVEGGVHPVLTFFGISFSIRDGIAPNYEVSARCVLGLWNPHSSALVPPAGENHRLELHVSGLPLVRVQDSQGGSVTIPLQDIMGTPTLRFRLDWPEEATREDEASWLPGRVYYWTAESNTTEPAGGNVMVFNERNSTFSGGGVVRPAGVGHSVAPPEGTVFRLCSVTNDNNTVLHVQLVRVIDQTTIATFESPKFLDFETSSDLLETHHKFVDFAFVFRLPDSTEIPEGESATWLSAAERDPRRSLLPGSAFVAGENGPRPEAYGGSGVTGLTTRYTSRLLDRATDSLSYNEDVPVFELPREPFLSVGALQHLVLPSARPFAIGNSWGDGINVNGMPANALFDRFFFSGLVQDVVPTTTETGDLVLPNPLLKPLRKADGTKLTIDDVRTMASPPSTTDADGNVIPGGPGSAYSSKFFLQGAAFNLNSTSPAAWAAVLRGIRFPLPQSFEYLDVAEASGTAEDDMKASISSADAQFFRFSQSAQETYKAEWPSATAEEGVTPPRTDLFRKGMLSLKAAQVSALADKIVDLVGMKHAASDSLGGPFRSLEEFLSPSALFAGVVDAEGNPGAPRSLLEAAIADAGINVDESGNAIEFSSQFLTQGDVMTALAPILFPRSDTFVIRTYGEAVNPVKLPLTYRPGDPIPPEAVEGRAWAEAIVQRVPEFFDPSLPPDTPLSGFDPVPDPNDSSAPPTSTPAQDLNKLYGRRFKVISFRWLTRSDI